MSISSDHILTMLESHNSDVRQTGLLWVARHQLYDFLGDVIQLTQDRDPEVRACAVWVLDIMKHPAALLPLIAALYDEDYGVRSNAGWGLVHLGPLVVKDVAVVLRLGTHQAREMAYQVLNRLETEEARDAIKKYWLA